MAQQRLAILGVGLLGGSIGLAAKSTSSDWHVIGYGHRKSTLESALNMGAIDEAADSPAAAVAGADLVILATPVGLFDQILRQIAGVLKPGALVTDVGSTKRSVVQLAEELLPANVHFIGSHPMAGSEKRGVEYARADLFRNATCILTPTRQTHGGAVERIAEFWKGLGMKLLTLSPEEHDRLLAGVSHLPHAVASALIALQDERALSLAGKGFLDSTRIAGGDGALWRDIFHDNRDNMKAAIKQLQADLDRLVELLEPGNAEALRVWLDAAASRRETLLQQKLREVTPD